MDSEILGKQTLNEALAVAQHYADLWGGTVDLYRARYLNISSVSWGETRNAIDLSHAAEARSGVKAKPGQVVSHP